MYFSIPKVSLKFMKHTAGRIMKLSFGCFSIKIMIYI
uniref:Uncharacterized protein n=1 Tax=Anguilla anguilla TaxID=7936 RepID=A0A0E9U4D5_ANGAN